MSIAFHSKMFVSRYFENLNGRLLVTSPKHASVMLPVLVVYCVVCIYIYIISRLLRSSVHHTQYEQASDSHAIPRIG